MADDVESERPSRRKSPIKVRHILRNAFRQRMVIETDDSAAVLGVESVGNSREGSQFPKCPSCRTCRAVDEQQCSLSVPSEAGPGSATQASGFSAGPGRGIESAVETLQYAPGASPKIHTAR